MSLRSEDKADMLFKDFKEACEGMGGKFSVGRNSASLCSIEGVEGDAIDILLHPDSSSLVVTRKYGKMLTKIHLDDIKSIVASYPILGMKIDSENGSVLSIDHKVISIFVDEFH